MVTIKECPVKAKSDVVGEARFPAFDSVDEAINNSEYGLGEQKVLELINAQVKTTAMNDLRTAKTKGPTKGALRNTAFSEIMVEMAAGEHQEVIGDEVALTVLIDRRMAELEERAKEALPVAEASDDDDEG